MPKVLQRNRFEGEIQSVFAEQPLHGFLGRQDLPTQGVLQHRFLSTKSARNVAWIAPLPRGCRTTAISGWREKSIHFKPRTTAIPLHGFVRFAILCDWRLCVEIFEAQRSKCNAQRGSDYDPNFAMTSPMLTRLQTNLKTLRCRISAAPDSCDSSVLICEICGPQLRFRFCLPASCNGSVCHNLGT